MIKAYYYLVLMMALASAFEGMSIVGENKDMSLKSNSET